MSRTFFIDSIHLRGGNRYLTKKMLEQIKVVPNPYIVRNTWERSKDYAQLQFINLPEMCTIRVYTLAGDHVQTIEHNEQAESDKPGWEWWELLTHNNQKIAAGIYFYHVEAPGVARIPNNKLIFSYTDWFSDVNHTFIGFIFHTGTYGYFGNEMNFSGAGRRLFSGSRVEFQFQQL